MSRLALDALHLRRVERALSQAVGGEAHRSSSRTAIALEVCAGPLRGHGEASPLPGYSRDTLEAGERALFEFATSMPRFLPSTVESIEALCAPLPAAARAGLETALLDLLGQVTARPLWAVLRDEAPARLPLCASLLGPDEELGAEAGSLVALGYTTLKRKIDDSVRRLDLLRSALAPLPIALRLDANRGLDLAALRALRPGLQALRPSLLEEPLELDLLGALDGDDLLGLPVALDESLAASSSAEALKTLARHAAALRSGRVRAVVLKPGRDGLLGALRLGQAASALGAEVLVSHLWDGAIGHLAAVQLAFAVGSPAAHGLAPQPGWGPDPGLARAALERLFDGGHLRRPSRPGLGDRP